MILFYSDQHKYEALSEYIRNYQLDLARIYRFPTTGHPVLDCLIASMLQKSSLYDIVFSYSVFLPSTFHMNELQLNVLLGNLMENAFDACRKVKEMKPEAAVETQFTIKPYQNMLAIHIENSSTGIYELDSDGTLLSVKEGGHLLHGIGIRRIRSIVEELHGVITIKPQKERFIVHILLPLQSVSSDIS